MQSGGTRATDGKRVRSCEITHVSQGLKNGCLCYIKPNYLFPIVFVLF